LSNWFSEVALTGDKQGRLRENVNPPAWWPDPPERVAVHRAKICRQRNFCGNQVVIGR
jgi:hypothetical protein